MAANALTEKEAEAIALVHQGYQTKEIARILEIAPSTVNQRVDGARKKLGAANRVQAARLFAAKGKIPERFIHEPLPLTPVEGPASPLTTPRDDLRFEDALFDERAAWDRGTLWRRPQFAPRDMGKASRLFVVFAIAVLMLLTAGEGVRFATSLGLMFSSEAKAVLFR